MCNNTNSIVMVGLVDMDVTHYLALQFNPHSFTTCNFGGCSIPGSHSTD